MITLDKKKILYGSSVLSGVIGALFAKFGIGLAAALSWALLIGVSSFIIGVELNNRENQ